MEFTQHYPSSVLTAILPETKRKY